MDVATELLAIRQAGTQQLAQILVMRKQHDAEMQLLAMIDETMTKAPTVAPPAPGTGTIVDKQA